MNQSATWEGSQLKTTADVDANTLYEKSLPDLLSVPVISEENKIGRSLERPNIYWLVDPIDGTRSLADGYCGWVTQAALIADNRPRVSIIFAPELNLMYTAEQGQGAFCNGKKLELHPSAIEEVSLIDNYPEPTGVAADLFNYLPCTSYLESGSISLKICRVADGMADLFVKNVVVRDWDVAAPHLVLEEAGGHLTTFCDQQFIYSGCFEKNGLIVASNKSLQQKCSLFVGQGKNHDG